MMKRGFLAGLVLVPLAACGPAPEPVVAPSTVEGPIESPPVYALLGYRQDLRLTSEQVVSLDSIGQALHTDNNPLIRRLRELRGELPNRTAALTGEDGEPLRPADEARAIFDQLRLNNRQALEGVQEVLSSEQESRVCQLFREADQQRLRQQQVAARRDSERTGTPRRRGGTSAEAQRIRSVWNWCGTPGATPGAQADTAVDGGR